MLYDVLSVGDYLMRISFGNTSLIVASTKRTSSAIFVIRHTGKNTDTQCAGFFYMTLIKKCTYKNIYRYKSSLAQHLKTVHHVLHNAYGKSYTCTKCNKLYVRFRAFQRHLLLHDDWCGENTNDN